MPDLKRSLSGFAQSARWTSFRLRLDEALQRGFSVLPVALVVAAGGLTVIKVAQPGPSTVRWLIALAVAPLLVGTGMVAHSFARRRPRPEGALALDRHHALADRIATALAFNEVPAAERTPLMWAAIEDAVERCPRLEPRRAAPLHLPREVPVVLGLALALFGLALIEVRHVREVVPERHFDPLVMPADDLELYDAYARQLSETSDDPELGALARRLNQVVEDIAAHRLDRKEAFERLADIERDLAKGSEADRVALEEGLKALAKELEKSSLSKPVADALEQKNLPDSEKAMRQLAERLKNKQNSPSRSELDKLRQALEKASKGNSERMKRLDERRQELEEGDRRLLKKKQQGQLSDKDKKDLEEHERQLKRLEREQDQAQRSQRQMSEIDKQLAQAASDLMKEAGMSGKDLEQGAQDMNRMAQKELSDKQKEELKKKLQELRELMRQQGQGGKERLARMLKFGQHARGQQGNGGDPQPGDGQGQGQQRPGQGQNGQGQGQGEGLTLSIGRGSGGTPIPGLGTTGDTMGGANQGADGKGQAKDPGSGAGAGHQSKEWGNGHDDNLTGDPSKLKGQTKDVAAVGVDTGKGSASSEVIYGAAQRGFVGHGYQQVYTDYKTVAERTIHRDEIPPGYRFYVQRYFQLIRPRD